MNQKIRGTHVILKENEDINRALRRFKNKIEDSGILKALQKKEFYEKPTSKRKRMKAAGKARFLKKLEKEQLPKKMY
ncbi:30S ribosomal protein S21 [bacterium]|nr:30S ribosomal protein S21 [bacterium]